MCFIGHTFRWNHHQIQHIPHGITTNISHTTEFILLILFRHITTANLANIRLEPALGFNRVILGTTNRTNLIIREAV